MRTTFVAQTSSYVAWVLPIILCAPKYLDGTMTLGQVMQAASAFTMVQVAFNWLVENYPRLAEWTASASRVASLLMALDRLEQSEGRAGHIQHATTTTAALRLQNLTVITQDGTILIKDLSIEIASGERVVLAGDSGTGKSTLVRAIAGLWPWGRGRIEVQASANMLLMPQRPYLPVGTLRQATTYPQRGDSKPLRDVARALEIVGLGYLVSRLEEQAVWDQILSGGEKQRLAFARVLLHRPQILVLDEATSALDPDSQQQMMEILTTRLRDTTIIRVAHRPELEACHTRKLTLERDDFGARLVADVTLPEGRARPPKAVNERPTYESQRLCR